MTTPPGWYPDPDPGNRADSPSAERWWDGNSWTGQTRTKAAVRGPMVAGVVGALVLVASLVVSALLSFAIGPGTGAVRDEAGGGAPTGEPAPPEEGPGAPEEDGGSPGEPEGDVPASGVDLPVLKGWERDPYGPMVTTGEYRCPGSEAESCLRGSSMIIVAPFGARDLESTARKDIGRFAKLAYSKGTYGGIKSHEAVATEKTSVAGQDAYRVRWKIVNRTKPDAYVESVAFTHPDGSGEVLLMRTGFDIAESAPPLSDMDKLAEGVTRSSEDPAGEDV